MLEASSLLTRTTEEISTFLIALSYEGKLTQAKLFSCLISYVGFWNQSIWVKITYLTYVFYLRLIILSVEGNISINNGRLR